MKIIDASVLEKELNEVQRKAAINVDNPQLILAGAGSGKTRVVTYKIAHLVSHYKIPAYKILAVTFTNKAAGEMKERLAKLLEDDLPFDWMGTFHSICVRILRYSLPKEPDLSVGVGSLTRNFSIYDDSDQKRIFKEIFKKLEMDAEASKVKRIRSYISNWKNKAMGPEEAIASAEYADEKEIAKMYLQYQNALKENNALDFDDLLNVTVQLLKRNDVVREQYRSRFEYFFVDEYQDTNPVQFDLIKLLTSGVGTSPNVTVVGDDDQSIYGWRGADISIIRRFSTDFKNVKIVKLEQNYRSSRNIVHGANTLIRNNIRTEEFKKNVFSEKEDGDKIQLIKVGDERAEAQYIASAVKALGSEKYSDVAVFYRTNSQSRVLEEQMNRSKIPCTIIGGTRFYDRKEVKDILAYLRFLANPLDEISLERIINVPRRGIGPGTIDKVKQAGRQAGTGMYQAIMDCDTIIERKGTAAKLKSFAELIEDFKSLMGIEPLPILVEKVITDTGYKSALVEENSPESEERLNNIAELLNAVVEFEEHQPGASLDQYLQEASLLTSVDLAEEGAQSIKLMTLHAAKGLEFPYVYIAGCDEKLLPMSRGDDDSEVEEERRLFYVGMTRAQESLNLYSARCRKMYGRDEVFQPSRFLGEIDENVLDEIDFAGGMPRQSYASVGKPAWKSKGGGSYGGSSGGGYSGSSYKSKSYGSGGYSGGAGTSGGYQKKSPSSSGGFGASRPSNSTGGSPSVNSSLRKKKSSQSFDDFSQESVYLDVGCKVTHPKFGLGVIKACEGQTESSKVEVAFKSGTTKKLILKYANLQIVQG
ncbi:MAG: UvrD-helicase domain-containing protein [Fibrobacterales bacterium]